MRAMISNVMSLAGESEADSATISPQRSHHNNNDKKAAIIKSYNSEEDDKTTVLLRCKACEKFTTLSSRQLSAHMTQCTMAQDNNNVPPGAGLQSSPGTAGADSRPHRKLFECDVCNMKFSNGANMRRHKMRHTGVKPYECRVCQKRFFRKDHLAEHFTTHTKSLPYHCPICNRGFQRQIAMRAHFQNEHVGQHDLVKTCPLCSYRAPTMKSLRVHFFNRHGIDLDNPGPGGNPVSLLAAGLTSGALSIDGSLENSLGALGSLGPGLSVSVAATYSDSGDSTGARSTDNATPPMHFLTPHVEISMADNETYSPGGISESMKSERLNGSGEGPNSPQSGDSNCNVASSSHCGIPQMTGTNITPSISLIPIKQEPTSHDESSTPMGGNGEPTGGTGDEGNNNNNSLSISSDVKRGSGVTSSSLSSLIKVSPLKSLLREDLKRRITARGRGRTSMSPRASPSEGGVITSTHGELSGCLLNPASLVCTFCAISFPDSTLYFLHKGCHCDSNPWKCNICGEQCNNVYEFNSHLLSKSHQ
ncbi:uncharacterized protein LOC143911750 isoform X2 [Arctopsyche grandis]|uniref:uncharacterized protein LOC143911750 isoform X2 n=1 Tax=Arctopsyche grandis TaxID=121162 RepID=UPI00406D8615